MSSAVTHKEELQRRIRRLEGLPAMPGALQQIWHVLRDPNCAARDLAGAIATDPALTSRILRMSNSAYYSLTRPLSDVREATVVLGFEVVKSIAIGSSVVDAFRGTGSSFDTARFWRHSVRTAVAAEGVARMTGGVRTEVAFCGGILHDVGKLALASVLTEEYERASAGLQTAEDGIAAEREALGVDHTTAGRWLGEKWNFSAELLEVIAHHHAPECAEESALRLVTAVALGESLLTPDEPPALEEDQVKRKPEWSAFLGVEEEALEMLRADLPTRLRAAGPMMGSF